MGNAITKFAKRKKREKKENGREEMRQNSQRKQSVEICRGSTKNSDTDYRYKAFHQRQIPAIYSNACTSSRHTSNSSSYSERWRRRKVSSANGSFAVQQTHSARQPPESAWRRHYRQETPTSCSTQRSRNGVEGGMVVYRNGNKEKVRLIKVDESSWQLQSPISVQNRGTKPNSRPCPSLETPCPKFNGEENNDSNTKKTALRKFWDSSFGKRLPIGGPWKWFKPKNSPRSDARPPPAEWHGSTKHSGIAKKHDSKWPSWPRRFLWKTVTKKKVCNDVIRVVTAPANGNDAELPCRPSCSHHCSKAYKWENGNPTTAKAPHHTSHSECHSASFRVLSCEPFGTVTITRPKSPYFASRFLWRSPNNRRVRQTWEAEDDSAMIDCCDRIRTRNTTPVKCSLADGEEKNRKFLWRKSKMEEYPLPYETEPPDIEIIQLGNYRTSKSCENYRKPPKRFLFNSIE